MPNWCLNKLTVSHTDKAAMDRFVKAYNKGALCNEFLPIPEGYLEDGRWYDWCVANWQTKWDVGSDNNEAHGLNPTVVGNQATMTFDSAWSPPIGLYERLVELGFDVEATYWEPGMAYCGLWQDGEDHYVGYTRHDMIPKRLWDEYNMGEFFEDKVEA